MKRSGPTIRESGEDSLLIELSSDLSIFANRQAQTLASLLRSELWAREVVPGFVTVGITYDVQSLSLRSIKSRIRKLFSELGSLPAAWPQQHEIPVVYDGPDLAEVAGAVGLNPSDVIALHTSVVYQCYAIGFIPGWANLGPLPEQLQLPRRKHPRTLVPTGTVAIAGRQTGVYPMDSPGGWHLLGKTTVPMFLPESDPPCRILPGDQVRFRALSS